MAQRQESLTVGSPADSLRALGSVLIPNRLGGLQTNWAKMESRKTTGIGAQTRPNIVPPTPMTPRCGGQAMQVAPYTTNEAWIPTSQCSSKTTRSSLDYVNMKSTIFPYSTKGCYHHLWVWSASLLSLLCINEACLHLWLFAHANPSALNALPRSSHLSCTCSVSWWHLPCVRLFHSLTYSNT